MTYAKDSLGRSTGRQFNTAAIKRELAAKREAISRKEAARSRKQELERQHRLDHPVTITF